MSLTAVLCEKLVEGMTHSNALSGRGLEKKKKNTYTHTYIQAFTPTQLTKGERQDIGRILPMVGKRNI